MDDIPERELEPPDEPDTEWLVEQWYDEVDWACDEARGA
jgi:hypothetical protein